MCLWISTHFECFRFYQMSRETIESMFGKMPKCILQDIHCVSFVLKIRICCRVICCGVDFTRNNLCSCLENRQYVETLVWMYFDCIENLYFFPKMASPIRQNIVEGVPKTFSERNRNVSKTEELISSAQQILLIWIYRISKWAHYFGHRDRLF